MPWLTDLLVPTVFRVLVSWPIFAAVRGINLVFHVCHQNIKVPLRSLNFRHDTTILHPFSVGIANSDKFCARKMGCFWCSFFPEANPDRFLADPFGRLSVAGTDDFLFKFFRQANRMYPMEVVLLSRVGGKNAVCWTNIVLPDDDRSQIQIAKIYKKTTTQTKKRLNTRHTRICLKITSKSLNPAISTLFIAARVWFKRQTSRWWWGAQIIAFIM